MCAIADNLELLCVFLVEYCWSVKAITFAFVFQFSVVDLGSLHYLALFNTMDYWPLFFIGYVEPKATINLPRNWD